MREQPIANPRKDSVISISDLIKEQLTRDDYKTLVQEANEDNALTRGANEKYFLMTTNEDSIGYLFINGRTVEFDSVPLKKGTYTTAIVIELLLEKMSVMSHRQQEYTLQLLKKSAFKKFSATENTGEKPPISSYPAMLRPRSRGCSPPLFNPIQEGTNKGESKSPDSGCYARSPIQHEP